MCRALGIGENQVTVGTADCRATAGSTIPSKDRLLHILVLSGVEGWCGSRPSL